MPIDYSKYPPNWKTEIRPAILERAKHCCEECGVKNYSIGYRDKNDVWHEIPCSLQGDVDADDARADGYKIIKIVLTVAHLDHDTTNNEYTNLKALCQKHHLHHDKEHHKKNVRATLNKKKKQTELFTNENL